MPTIDTAISEPYKLEVKFTHLDIEDTSILYGYKVIYRQLGSLSWDVKAFRKSLFSHRTTVSIRYLKPYRNYTLRLFPYSLLGDRLGSKLKMFETTEKGEQPEKFFRIFIIQS